MAEAADAIAGDGVPPVRHVEPVAGASAHGERGAPDLAIAVAPPPLPKRTVVVDPAVSATKLQRELDDWAAAESMYRQRGILVRQVDAVIVEATFIRRGQLFPAPYVAACIEFDYTNYDLEPPSLTFIDPFTGGPGAPYLPIVHVDQETKSAQALVPGPHPATGLPFLCIQGTWEYHSHMEHTNEPWLGELRRNRAGSLAVLASRVASALDDIGFAITFVPAIVGGKP